MTTRPRTKGLTFNAGNHQYRLDGKHVPGVTTILGVPADLATVHQFETARTAIARATARAAHPARGEA